MLLNWAFIALVPLAQAIHKDQIGQLDWLKSHIGVPSHVSFARSQSGASLALGSVAANTVSVLSPATGSFVWRQHFAANEKLLAVERVSTNVIAAVAYLPSSDSFAIRTFDAASGFVLTDVVASAGRNKVCTPNACNGSVRVVAVPASGRTKTSDFVALLPGGKVIRVDAARGELAWQQTVTSTPSANLEVNDQQVFVVSSSDANDFSVEVLALADGALRSSTAPSIKTVSCFVQSDAAVLCNLQRGGVTAFVAGNKKAVALDAGSLFEGEDVSSKTLSVISLGHRTNEYIVSSGGRAVVVTLDANSDKAVVSRRHTFSSISPADSPIYSATTGDKRNPFIARLVVSKKANAAEVQLFDVEGSKGVESFSFPIDFGETGSIKSIHLDTVLKDGVPTMRILAVFEDGTVSLLQQGKSSQLNAKWSRDESLAHIVDAAFVDLPDENMFSLENDELGEPLKDSKQRDPVSRLLKRWGSHAVQLQEYLTTLPTRFLPVLKGSSSTSNDTVPLFADRLGFRKLLVVVTSTGKIHALETEFGKSIWTRWVGSSYSYSANDLEVLRAGAVKFPPVVGIFGTSSISGDVIVHRINAITGADFVTEQVPAVTSLADADQIILVPGKEEKDHTNVYAVVDSENKITVYPNTNEAVDAFVAALPTFYYYRVKKGDPHVKGYIVDNQGKNFVGKPVWSIDLPEHEVVADFATKDRTEPVSSLGRVLGNRSVLYKYLNPNFLALATLRETKSSSNVYLYLIDTVTGSIYHHSAYVGAGHAAPGLDSIFILQVDNSIILSYYNHGPERAEILVEPETRVGLDMEDVKAGEGANKRRKKSSKKAAGASGNVVKNTAPNVKGYEITVLEAYEMPKADARVESDTYTSFNVKKPSFLQQTYVFPHQITAIGATRTGAGITSREILFGLSSQQLYGVNLRILDPRRPYGAPTAEDKEEMLFPYRAVVDFNPKELASHVLEVAGIKTIVSTASTLESTSIVVAYGLDLFLTRRAPSKTFDLLSEDFGYFSLIMTLVCLVVGIQVAKYYAERKRVYDQWK